MTSLAQTSPPAVVPQAVVDQWVTGLGADDYLLRVKSEEEILQIGSVAIDSIKVATESPDIEVSIRAQRLLAKLIQQDFELRKKNFLAAPAESRDNFGFRGWDGFVKWVNRSDRAKRLFVDIVQNRQEKKLGHRGAAAVSYLGYLSTEQQQYTPLPTTAVEIADELLERLNQPENTSSLNQHVVVQQLSLSGFEANLPKTLVKTVRESEYVEEIKTLTSHWIRANMAERGLTRNQIESIYQFELTGFTEQLRNELEDERSKVRLQAAEAIARTGGPDAVKLLGRFLRGDEVVVTYPEPISGRSLEVTLGDIVFQLILRLEDRSLKDFGLLSTAGTMLLSDLPVYGFSDRDSATEAISRWESQR